MQRVFDKQGTSPDILELPYPELSLNGTMGILAPIDFSSLNAYNK
jgi:hypothetical protein